VLTTPQDVVNQLVPNKTIMPYEVFIVNVNEKLYLTKVQDRVVGDTQPPVSAGDFISLTPTFTFTVPDATASVKGILKLTGDLGGTADAPTTPTAVHKTGNESISGTKTINNSLATPGRFIFTTFNDATTLTVNATTSSPTVPAMKLEGNATNATALLVSTFNPNATGIRIETNQNTPQVGTMLVLSNKLTGNSVVDISTPLTVLRNAVTVAKIDDLGNITGNTFVKTGGTASQFLKADGSVSLIDGSETIINNGISTTKSGNGTSATPYIIEVNNLQKQLTYPASFTGTNYTLTNADFDNLIFVNNGATAVTITVPASLVQKFTAAFIRQGSGDVSFIASGTTVTPNVGLRIKNQNDAVCLDKVLATEDYHLTGNTKV
jgi:hypothetical protein